MSPSRKEPMSIRSIYSAAKHVLGRIAHVLARPVRRDRGRGGILIQPYRGYGSTEEVFLMGRVFRQHRIGNSLRTTVSRRDLLDVVRRVLRRGVRNAVLEARLCGAGEVTAAGGATAAGRVARFQTDPDGYFRVCLRPEQRLANDRLWHRIELQLVEPAELADSPGAKVHGEVFVLPPTARRVIISDIDDTVMYTGVVNKAKMIWRLFMQGPRSRVAFPGVASLYRALHDGPSGDQVNPMLYVSRAPWSIYEVLQEFFLLHRIPHGPILFLREWGISWKWPFPRRAEDHKLLLIRDMLQRYHDLPFVLIGDSGQHDPEVYAQLVEEFPGRVEAVYIRNVTRSADRVRAIETLAKRVLDSGSTLMLAADSFSMARHAAEHGLIAAAALAEVLGEQDEELAPAPLRPTHEIKQATDAKTRRAIERGELKETLAQETETDAPPNVAVESRER